MQKKPWSWVFSFPIPRWQTRWLWHSINNDASVQMWSHKIHPWGFIELLYLLCMAAEEPVLKLKCPKEFKLIQADGIIGVCFELELKEMELQFKELKLRKKDEELHEIWKRISKLEEELKTSLQSCQRSSLMTKLRRSTHNASRCGKSKLDSEVIAFMNAYYFEFFLCKSSEKGLHSSNWWNLKA